LALPKLEGLPTEEREKMIADARPGIRFCDEYESLMSEFLRSLSAWTQLRCFEQAHVTINSAPVAAPCAEVELARSRGSYVATLWALRKHSRNCLQCAETLRVVNGGATPTSIFRASYC
jgi:hypothetical protein